MKIREKLDIPRRPEEFAYFNPVPDYFIDECSSKHP